MKQFYLAYADESIWQRAVAKLGGRQVSAFLQHAVAEIPWGQNLHILNKVAEGAG